MAKQSSPNSKQYDRAQSRTDDSKTDFKKARNKRKGRQQRNYRRDAEDTFQKRSYDNDISWYSKYPELLSAAASIPYPYKPGMELPLSSGVISGTYVNPTVPGILALTFIPSLGVTTSATDPASIAAKEIYAKVRAAFSGRLYADAPDFVIYLGALDSIFSYIAWLKRVYRCLNAYSPVNYQTPDAVLASFGFKPSEIQQLRTNKTEFWQMINTLVLMTRKFTCPAVMDLFNRHYWMNDNVYTDTNSVNAQFYVFNQVAWYQFAMLPENGNTSVLAGGLQLMQLRDPMASVTPVWNTEYLFSFGQQLIAALAESDDAYTIAGYLAKAFDGTPSFMVDEIDQMAQLEPIYSEEVLAQIENSRVLDIALQSFNPASFNIVQDVANNVVYWPGILAFTDAAAVNMTSHFNAISEFSPTVSVRSDNPSVQDTVIATRLQAFGGVTTQRIGDEKGAAKISCGTEIPLGWAHYSTNAVDNVSIATLAAFSTSTSATTFFNVLSAYTFLTQFDWMPIIRVKLTANGTSYLRLFGDTHNTTVMTYQQLQQIHRVCVESELNAFAN